MGMRKNTLGSKIMKAGLATGLAALVLGNKESEASDIILSSEAAELEANGVTQYKVKIEVAGDADGVSGVDFRVLNGTPLVYVSASVSLPDPASSDLFYGYPMEAHELNAPNGGVSFRYVEGFAPGPVNQTGRVAEFFVTVPVGTPPGDYFMSFDPSFTFLWDNSVNQNVPDAYISNPLTVVEPVAASMKTTPQYPFWPADGETRNLLFINVDTTPLNQITDFIEGRLNENGFVSEWYVNGSVSVPEPESSDFFRDIPNMDNFLMGPLSNSGRGTLTVGAGPTNREGRFLQYEFIVPQGTSPGVITYDLNSVTTNLFDQNFNQQPRTLSADPIQIVNNYSEVAAPCVGGPGSSYTTGSDCSYFDFDGDGDVDLRDMAEFQLRRAPYSGPE